MGEAVIDLPRFLSPNQRRQTMEYVWIGLATVYVTCFAFSVVLAYATSRAATRAMLAQQLEMERMGQDL